MECSISVWTLFVSPLFVRTLILIGITAQTLLFLLLYGGEMLLKRLLDRARLPLHIHFYIMRMPKLANHLLVLAQADLRSQTVHDSLLHVVLVASYAMPQLLLYKLRLY